MDDRAETEAIAALLSFAGALIVNAGTGALPERVISDTEKYYPALLAKLPNGLP